MRPGHDVAGSTDKIWRLTVDLPPGQYEYKAALNGGWDVNYGADGALNGPDVVLNHPGGPVTFRYDNSTHVVSPMYTSQQPGAVAAAGSMKSEFGCATDGEPACDQAQLVLDPADLVWKRTVPNHGGAVTFRYDHFTHLITAG